MDPGSRTEVGRACSHDISPILTIRPTKDAPSAGFWPVSAVRWFVRLRPRPSSTSSSLPTKARNCIASKAPPHCLSLYTSRRGIPIVSTGTRGRIDWFLSTHLTSLGATNEKIQAFGTIRVKADISQSAWSESAQRFARGCIETCNKDHEKCRFTEPLLPTRVINVGNVGDERLRLETPESKTGHYTALSYCWGSDQPLKTTSANIKAMESGLFLSDLPQTLADAVYVTRSLGIQYLWIDALCIIQDNVDDWEKESAKMSTIYEKSYLVIAASSSSSATQGFLGHERQHQPHYVSIPEKYGTRTTIAARRDPKSGVHNCTERKTDPLDQRAWAFQELHMSTRCLIFSTDELQWKCRTTAVCECGRTATRSSHHPLLLACCDDTYQDDVASTELRLQAGDVWRSVVSAYNCRSLTHADDKLPAISGIASRFGATMGFRYVAGLWEENIVKDLAWKQDSWPPIFLPTDDMAPSFSWASINNSVSYVFNEYDHFLRWIPCASVSDARTFVPGHNPFGKVTDASITLQAPMLRGVLKGHSSDSFHNEFLFNDRKMTVHVEMDSTVTVFSYIAENGVTEKSVRRWNVLRHARHAEHRREQPKLERGGEAPITKSQNQTTPTVARDFNPPVVWLVQLGIWKMDQAGRQMDNKAMGGFYLVLGKSPRDPQKYERIAFYDGVRGGNSVADHGKFTTQTITIL